MLHLIILCVATPITTVNILCVLKPLIILTRSYPIYARMSSVYTDLLPYFRIQMYYIFSYQVLSIKC